MAEVQRIILQTEVQAEALRELNAYFSDTKRGAEQAESGIKRLNDELTRSALKGQTLQQQYDKVEKEIRDLQRASQKLATLQKQATNSSDVQKYNVAWSRTNIELDKARKELLAIERAADKAGTKINKIDPGKALGRGSGVIGDLLGQLGPGSGGMIGSLTSIAGLTGPVGIAIGAVGAAGAAAFSIANNEGKEFENALLSLQSILGLTDDELNKLKDTALNTGFALETSAGSKQITRNAIEAAKAFEIIGSRVPTLLESQEALAEFTNRVILLDEASQTLEFDGAVDALTIAVNQFLGDGASFNDVVNTGTVVMNQLAAAAQIGAVPIDGAAASLKNFGSVAAANNVTTGESIALTEVLGQRLVDPAQTGTALRNVIQKLSTAQGEFQLKNGDVIGSLKALKAANLDSVEIQKIFSAENEAAVRILLANVEQLESFTKTLEDQAKAQFDNGVAAQQAAVNAKGLENAQKNLSNAVTNLKAQLGAGLTPVLTALTEFLIDAIEVGQEMSPVFGEIAEGGRILLIPINALIDAFSSTGDEAEEVKEKGEGVSLFVKTLRGLLRLLAAPLSLTLGLIGRISKALDTAREAGGGFVNTIKSLINAMTFIDIFELPPIDTTDAEASLDETGEKVDELVDKTNNADATLKVTAQPENLEELKAQLDLLNAAFEKARSRGEQVKIANEIKSVETRISQIRSIIKPDPAAKQKAKDAEKKQKEEERKALEEAREIETITQLTARIEIEALKVNGQDTEASLKRTLEEELRQLGESPQFKDLELKLQAKAKLDLQNQYEEDIKALESSESFQNLTIDLQAEAKLDLKGKLEEDLKAVEDIEQFKTKAVEIQNQARLNIETQYAEKIKKVREGEAGKLIELKEQQLDRELQAIARTLAEESLKYDNQLASRLQAENLTKDEIQKIEDEIAAKKIEAAQTALDAQLEAINALKDANAERITQINEELKTADAARVQQLELELSSRIQFQQKLEDDVLEVKQKAADQKVKVAQEGAEREAQQEIVSTDKKLEAIGRYIDIAGQLNGQLASVFEAVKERELRAAGDNKEKIAEIERKDFNRRKALQLVDIAINTAAAIVKAIAQFGPPPSPAGIAGIATASAIGLIQAGVVASRQAPQSFFEGTKSIKVPRIPGRMGRDSVDAVVDGHHPIRVHSGERITPESLNRKYGDTYDKIEEGKSIPQIMAEANGIPYELVQSFIADPYHRADVQIPKQEIRDKSVNGRILSPSEIESFRILHESFPNDVPDYAKAQIGVPSVDSDVFGNVQTPYPSESPLYKLVLGDLYSTNAKDLEGKVLRELHQNNVSQVNKVSESLKTIINHRGEHVSTKEMFSKTMREQYTQAPIRPVKTDSDYDYDRAGLVIAKQIKTNESDLDHVQMQTLKHIHVGNETIIQLLKKIATKNED